MLNKNPMSAENPSVRVLVAILLSVATAAALRFAPMPSSAGGAGVTMSLPARVDSFEGRDQNASEGERVVLPKDTEIIKKTYTDAS